MNKKLRIQWPNPLILGAMRVDLAKLHNRAKDIFDRENLKDYRYRVVAFVLDDRGHIITEGWNSYTKTHPIQRNAALEHNDEFKQYLHAEIHALSRLSYKQLSRKDSIVVLRMNSNKELLPGKPCPICSSVIGHYGISNIIHS